MDAVVHFRHPRLQPHAEMLRQSDLFSGIGRIAVFRGGKEHKGYLQHAMRKLGRQAELHLLQHHPRQTRSTRHAVRHIHFRPVAACKGQNGKELCYI